MISHKHKCIFIHISKCAGSSIESAFGIDVHDNTENNHKNLFGWDKKNKIHLQHATPQQLLDLEYITKDIWENYNKFIVVRNPYSRILSDYFWVSKTSGIRDSFSNFLLKRGKYKKILCNKDYRKYRGDHLNSQISYFKLNGKVIEYDNVVKFENFEKDITNLSIDYQIKSKILKRSFNKSNNPFSHYSLFYNRRRRKLIETKFHDDFQFLNYKFEDKKSIKSTFRAFMPSVWLLNLK